MKCSVKITATITLSALGIKNAGGNSFKPVYGHEQQHILSANLRVKAAAEAWEKNYEKGYLSKSLCQAAKFGANSDLKKEVTKLLATPDHANDKNPTKFSPGHNEDFDPLPNSPFMN